MKLTLKKGSLQRNIFFMMMGNGVFAFSQWVQISLISKYSSIETLGIFTLAISIIGPVFMFSGLQLRTLIITESDVDMDISPYLNLRFILSVFSFLIIVLIGFFLTNKNLLPFLILLSFQKIIEGISELFNSKQQQLEQIENLAQSLLLKGLAIFISMWLGLVIFNSLLFALILILVFYLLIVYFNDYRSYHKRFKNLININPNIHDLLPIAIKGLPLGIVLLIISLNANVSKYFLESYCGTEIQAVYSSISYILVLGLFVLDSLGQSFVPRMSKYFYGGKFYQFKKLFFTFISLSIIIGFILYFLSLFYGKEGLRFLFNEKISQYSEFLSWYLLVSILTFIASSLGYSLTSMGEFKVQPLINFAILTLNVILSFLLIKKFQLDGVLIILASCFSLQIIITSILIFRKLHNKKELIIT